MTAESEKNRTEHGSPSKEEAKCYLEPNMQDNRKQRTARNSYRKLSDNIAVGWDALQ